MTSKDNNQQIRYEGNALMWQGSNRFRLIASTSTGRTGVCRRKATSFSNCSIQAETQKQKKGPMFTIVKAPQMLYLDKERVAHYQGGVVLNARHDGRQLA